MLEQLGQSDALEAARHLDNEAWLAREYTNETLCALVVNGFLWRAYCDIFDWDHFVCNQLPTHERKLRLSHGTPDCFGVIRPAEEENDAY